MTTKIIKVRASKGRKAHTRKIQVSGIKSSEYYSKGSYSKSGPYGSDNTDYNEAQKDAYKDLVGMGEMSKHKYNKDYDYLSHHAKATSPKGRNMGKHLTLAQKIASKKTYREKEANGELKDGRGKKSNNRKEGISRPKSKGKAKYNITRSGFSEKETPEQVKSRKHKAVTAYKKETGKSPFAKK